MNRTLAAFALAAASSSLATAGGPLFSDNFNGENGGVGVLNYGSFSNWTVSGGTVDLIGNGFFDYYPGNGLYVDLDGTSLQAGALTSVSINFLPGVYTLSFVLAGRPDGATSEVTVTLGSLYSEVFTVPINAPFAVTTRSITVVAPATASLVFQNSNNNNFGAILDDVSIVPAPGAAVVMLGALAFPAARRRR